MSKKEPLPTKPEKGLDALVSSRDSYSTMHIELPAHVLDKVDTAKKTVRIAGRKKLSVTSKKKHPLPHNLNESPLQETAFQNLLQNVYDGVFIIDLEGDILEVNERAAYLLSSEGTELTNRSLFDIIPGTDESLIGTITDNLKADRFTLVNAWCLKDDGSQFPVEISANWLELEENKYLNLFMRDITRRVENEEKLESFAQELKAKNEALENDLVMARELQQAFVLTDIPSQPEAATPEESQVQFGRIYIPSGAVSGDYIDIRRIDEHKIGVFMGDVSGHGLRAALIVSYLRGLFEQLSGSADNPGEFIYHPE